VGQLSSFLASNGFPVLTEVTAEHIREWLSALRDRGNKPATVNTRYRAANAFYGWLLREGEVRTNPLDTIESPRIPETVQPHYTPDDLNLVLKSLQGRRLRGIDALRTRALILVLFDTGLRASELCGLGTDDVNWDNQTMVVRQPKGGNERVVSFGITTARSLISYLRQRRVQSAWVFATLTGERLTKNALKLAVGRAFKAAGLEFKGIHAFRRASGIAYLRKGGQAEDLRVLMGWRSPEMVRRYVHAAEVERATAAHKRFSPADGLERI
jgi:integrase